VDTRDRGSKDVSTIVALVGPRCSGKTSVGRELAKRLGWSFADLDDEVGRLHAQDRKLSAAVPAGEVLLALGEPAFRELEARALREVVTRGGPLVLATGGGAVESEASRALLSQRATCVWLRVAQRELERRMRADATLRPSLTGGDAVAEIGAILARREPLYSAVAQFAIDCRGLDAAEIAEETVRRIGRGRTSGCRS
jgi:shikimate kinase